MSDPSPNGNLAAISLGSNINPVQNLKAAVCELGRYGTIRRASRAWESAPVGFLDQANFLNAAVLWETPLSPDELKRTVLVRIEQKLLRVRDPNNINAPRTIDLDLSLYLTAGDSLVFDEDILTRPFVAVPLAEILPDFVHPQTGQTLAEIATAFMALSPELTPRPDCDLKSEIARHPKPGPKGS